MLHARVLRPGAIGASLIAYDDSAAKKVDGFVRTVRKGDFLAVLATTEWGAVKAMRALQPQVQWGGAELLPDPATVFDHWRGLKLAKQDVTQTVGDAPAALAAITDPTRKVKARYDFAVQTHASMGPSCAVADYRDGQITVWSASQATHSLVTEIAPIVGAGARQGSHRLPGRLGLLRPQRPRGRVGRRRAAGCADRPAGARAVDARRRDGALTEEPAAVDRPRSRARRRRPTSSRGAATSGSR